MFVAQNAGTAHVDAGVLRLQSDLFSPIDETRAIHSDRLAVGDRGGVSIHYRELNHVLLKYA